MCDVALLHRGDYRTGKRLNMRKVIPYIASQFRKDKIWLRRTKPSKREYQICLAVDDSSSMVDNHSKQVREPRYVTLTRRLYHSSSDRKPIGCIKGRNNLINL